MALTRGFTSGGRARGPRERSLVVFATFGGVGNYLRTSTLKGMGAAPPRRGGSKGTSHRPHQRGMEAAASDAPWCSVAKRVVTAAQRPQSHVPGRSRSRRAGREPPAPAKAALSEVCEPPRNDFGRLETNKTSKEDDSGRGRGEALCSCLRTDAPDAAAAARRAHAASGAAGCVGLQGPLTASHWIPARPRETGGSRLSLGGCGRLGGVGSRSHSSGAAGGAGGSRGRRAVP